MLMAFECEAGGWSSKLSQCRAASDNVEVGRFAYRLICGVLLGVINVFLDACSHFSNPTIRKARMH